MSSFRPVVDLAELDEIITVHDGDAILMAQKLARELGLGVGISSGANLAGAIALQNRMGDDAVVATVFPDSNKKYPIPICCARSPCASITCRGTWS